MYITFGNVTLISCLQLNAKKTVDYAAQKPMQLGSPNTRRRNRAIRCRFVTDRWTDKQPDGQMGGHQTIAYTALASHRAVKMLIAYIS